MNEPLSILITRFPFESVLSGEEWHTITLAEKLRERGHKVAFMGSCKVLLEELAKRDFSVCKQPGGPIPVSGGMLARFLLAWPYLLFCWWWTLGGLKKRHGLTTVYMHSLSEKVLLTPVARMYGLRVVWVEHQPWRRWMLGNPLRHVYKAWSRHVDIIGVSPLYQEHFRQLGLPEDHTHIITNGIDLQFFHPEVQPLPLGNGVHIGTVARLSVDKGVDVLLKAFSQLCERAKRDKWTEDLHLHIVGEGPLKDELVTQTKALPCSDKVHFYVPYRTMPRADIPKFYKALDILVLSSATPDPFGLIAAEAMAVATATIVTDVCGIRYQLTSNVDSIIVKAASVEDLEKALYQLAHNQALRENMGKAGRATAERAFSLEHMVDKYLKLLRPI